MYQWIKKKLCDLVTIHFIWNWWMSGQLATTWTIKLECNSFIFWFFQSRPVRRVFCTRFDYYLEKMSCLRAHEHSCNIATYLIEKGWRFYISNSYWMSNQLKKTEFIALKCWNAGTIWMHLVHYTQYIIIIYIFAKHLSKLWHILATNWNLNTARAII